MFQKSKKISQRCAITPRKIMDRYQLSIFVVVSLLSCLVIGCNERSSELSSTKMAVQLPSATALWANRQVDVLLSGKQDTLFRLADQLSAIALIDGGDWDASLTMDLYPGELEIIWSRVHASFDTEWVRGYMITGTRLCLTDRIFGA